MFYANRVFYFAGMVIVTMPYHWIQIKWAVLTLHGHYIEGVLMAGTRK